MVRFKKILCPTDFSEPSYHGRGAANELGSLFGAELYLVHVIPVIPTVTTPGSTVAAFDIGGYQQGLEQSAKKDLERIIGEKVAKNLTAHGIVGYGDAAHEIIRIADEQNVDVIVMATHGRTGWRHFMFGSVAERVVRFSPHPVLISPAPREQK